VLFRSPQNPKTPGKQIILFYFYKLLLIFIILKTKFIKKWKKTK